MGVNNCRNSNVGNVKLYLDTAYDHVKIVADNIDAILDLEESFSNLDGNYLGTSALEPVLRPDTTPLQNGDSYFNTTLNAFYVFIFDTVTWVQHSAFYGQEEFESAVGAGPFNVWIAYADDAVGNGISLLPSNKNWMGTSNTKSTSVVDISDPSQFKWQLVRGETGLPGTNGLDGLGGDPGNDGSDGVVQIESPIAPTNVVLTTTTAAVKITWDAPTYGGHWYTKVYKTTWDGLTFPPFDEGFFVNQVQGDFIDASVESNSNYLYWLRHVNLDGIESTLAGGNGFTATTGLSLAEQTDWLTEVNLNPSLETRIALIDSQLVNPADGGLVSAFTVLDTTVAGLTTEVGIVTASGEVTTSNLADLNADYLLTKQIVGDENAGLFYEVGLNTTSGAGNSAAIALNLTSIGGLEANFSVKIDINSQIVAGIGLMATTADDGNVTSSFAVYADKFLIATPGNTTSVPFLVSGPNTYINIAFIEDASIVNAKIGNLAVTKAKIDLLAVDTAQIALLAVESAQINALAVTTAKIALLAVGTAQIGALAATTAKIGALAVTEAKIAALAVTNAKIGNLAVDTAKIADLSVETLKIAGNAVTQPVGSFVTGPIVVNWNGGVGTLFHSETINANGAPIFIQCSFYRSRIGDDADAALSLFRGNTLIHSVVEYKTVDTDSNVHLFITHYDANPGTGILTYNFWARPGDSSDIWSVHDVSTFMIGMKK